jgi:hypothetical protein
VDPPVVSRKLLCGGRLEKTSHSGGPSGQCTRVSARASRVAGNAAHMAGDLWARDGSAQGGPRCQRDGQGWADRREEGKWADQRAIWAEKFSFGPGANLWFFLISVLHFLFYFLFQILF